MPVDTTDNLPGAVEAPIRQHVDSIDIAAPPSRVWGLVTALDRYGEWSSENAGGTWRKREDGTPCTGEVGDTFSGVNRLGEVEWKVPVEIVQREEERDFAFVMATLKFPFVLWRYQLEPDDEGGTTLTESWTLRALTPNMVEQGEAEIDQREQNARTSIRATLEGIKAAAEAS
ncbi:MAG: SRPBCC family protein [Ilumatobacteraceae bacterium]